MQSNAFDGKSVLLTLVHTNRYFSRPAGGNSQTTGRKGQKDQQSSRNSQNRAALFENLKNFIP